MKSSPCFFLRRTSYLLVAIAAASSSFSGCGGSEPSNGSRPGTNERTSQTPSSGGAGTVGGAPISSQTTTLSGGNSVGGSSARSSTATSGGNSVGGSSVTNSTIGIGGTAGAGGGTAGAAGNTSSGPWSMGYYASWKATQYPIDEIEWAGLTHVALAFYTPQPDGSLSLTSGSAQLAVDLVEAAHRHGKKAMASLGGADSASAFRAATTSAVLPKFVESLVTLMSTVGFDGFDVDWEPLATTDELIAIDLANRLRAAVPDAILTIPVGCLNVNIDTDLANFSEIAAVYDQINLMSYGLSGAWPGWKSWHSSPLFHEDTATPMSIDSSVELYLGAGVPKHKLGIGIGFYGLCYSPPVSAPGQALNGATLVTGDGAISYANIMSEYYADEARKWDPVARVPYLSFAAAQPPDGCGYISYDDERSVAEKAQYVKREGLGGVIAWEINEAYRADLPVGERNALLTAIGRELL